MNSNFSSILRSVNRNNKSLNILTAPTHEAYETQLCKTGHNFFALQHESFKKWNSQFRPIPFNYQLLNGDKIESQIKDDMKFDVVLSQNKFGQYQILSQIARSFNIPFVSIEHTLPMPQWPEKHLQNVKNMRGDLNLFISEFSIDKWGFNINDPSVIIIKHGIDSNLFSGWVGGDGKALSVCNDWINRDWCCGFNLWRHITNGIQVRPVGSTPGLSNPASTTDELVNFYRNASVFVNTSLISPIPTALLEAASVGCPIVTTATCEIPHIFDNGVNAIVSNDPNELKIGILKILNDKEFAHRIGSAAREMVLNKFSEKAFIENWDSILNTAASNPPLSWC